MNKKDREQLRACVAKNLVQGKRSSSATTELLKQYVPLDGLLTPQLADSLPSFAPVEKSLAPHATASITRHPAWHDADVAIPASLMPDATVELYAEVKGELRVPNTVNFNGFKRDTCIIGLAKLAKSLLMSQRKVQDTILYLEKRRLIKRVASILGGPSKGNVYQVMLPATVAPDATVTTRATLAGPSTSASQSTMEPVARRTPTKINSFKVLHQRDSRRARSPQPRLAEEAVGQNSP